jgi:rRNA processing protein Krr1/Pno1
MTEFENVLEVLRYNARCHRVSVLMGTKGAFGATYEEAVKSQVQLDEYEKAIEILENYKA